MISIRICICRIWNLYQAIYKTDKESIQEQFIILSILESRKNRAPYIDRCKLLNLLPFEISRIFNDAQAHDGL